MKESTVIALIGLAGVLLGSALVLFGIWLGDQYKGRK